MISVVQTLMLVLSAGAALLTVIGGVLAAMTILRNAGPSSSNDREVACFVCAGAFMVAMAELWLGIQTGGH